MMCKIRCNRGKSCRCSFWFGQTQSPWENESQNKLTLVLTKLPPDNVCFFSFFSLILLRTLFPSSNWKTHKRFVFVYSYSLKCIFRFVCVRSVFLFWKSQKQIIHTSHQITYASCNLSLWYMSVCVAKNGANERRCANNTYTDGKFVNSLPK